MAIRNINTIQHPVDTEELVKLNKEFYNESLANLGQRYGIAGDSIITSSFTLKDILGSILSEEDNDKYIFEVVSSKTDKTLSCKLIEKETKNPVSPDIDLFSSENFQKLPYIDITGNTDHITTTNVAMGMEYSGYIYSDAYTLTVVYKGINVGTIKEVIIITFSKLDNTIISGLRIFDNNKALYIKSSSKNNYNVYSLDTLYDIETYFENFCGGLVDWELIKPSYNKGDKLIDEVRNVKADTFADHCILQLFNSLNYVCNAVYEGPDNGFTAEQDSIKNDIYYFTLYLVYLFDESKKKWSDKVYTGDNDNTSLKKQLVYNICKEILRQSNGSERLYIPTEFVFNYSTSNNKRWKIFYNTSEVSVQYTSKQIDPNYLINNIGDDNTSIACGNSGSSAKGDSIERVSKFNFLVNYDSENDNIIDSIIVTKSYTLPYINSDGYWVLNDQETDVYARGKDAGNPNIVIIETHGTHKDNATPKVTSTVRYSAHKEIFDKLNKIPLKTQIRPIDIASYKTLEDNKIITDNDYLTIWCELPDLSEISSSYENRFDEWKTLIENSLIWCICDIECIDVRSSSYTWDELIKMYGGTGVFTTFWHPNDEFTQYECITKYNESNNFEALDFNYLANINNIINYKVNNIEQTEPDKYRFTYLVFDPVQSTLKNNTQLTPTYIYPNIAAIPSELYGQTNYGNDLNFTIRFNDAVFNKKGKDVNTDTTDRNIASVEQSASSRYLNTKYNKVGSLTANIVTNSLYRYINGSSESNYNEFIPNYNVPSLDLGEVLTRNETLLNRLNIMTFDNKGVTYNTYVGTSFDGNKNVFTIGSSETNINLGTSTLATESDRHSFQVQKEMHIDFDNTVISGYAYTTNDLISLGNVTTYGVNWTKTVKFSDSGLITDYWDCDYSPKGRYLYEVSSSYSGEQGEFPGIVNLNETNTLNTWLEYLSSVYFYKSFAKENDKCFAICRVPEVADYKVYFSDGIYIPMLLKDIGLEKYIFNTSMTTFTANKLSITSNMKIVRYGNLPLLLLSSSTMLYDKNKYNYSTVETSSTAKSLGGNGLLSDTYRQYFTGNNLHITYFLDKKTNILNVDIQEVSRKQAFTYIYPLMVNY